MEGAYLAMTYFTKGSKNIDEEKAKTFVVFELLASLIMFVAGLVIRGESEGKSLTGKILLITSIAVPVVQIMLGIVLNLLKKKRNK